MAQHLWVITYDISDDRARTRVERKLLGWGERVQYSVFECFLDHQQLHALRAELHRHIDPKTDSLRAYPLCQWCENRVQWQGQGRAPDDPDLIVL